jgi:competence protein ComGC
MFRNDRGFSVYTIISIVGALALIFVLSLPSFFNVNRKQKEQDCIRNMQEIYRAINQYQIDKRAPFKGDVMDLKNMGYLKAAYECPEKGPGDKYLMSGSFGPDSTQQISVTCPNVKEFPRHKLPQSFLDSMKSAE